MNNYRVRDNDRYRLHDPIDGKTLTSEDIANLQKIANVDLQHLSIDGNPNLLVFPQQLGYYGDDLGSSAIVDIRGDQMNTGNVMGFVGVGDTGLSITSRFASGHEDCFLHYMLSRVFALNIFDLNHTSKNDDTFDFLLYLFPRLLVKALSQGIIRTYQSRNFNDARVKGRVDVARHIRTNIPFNGRIAYTTREYSEDNEVTQLIRHTIEYISTHPFGQSVLNIDDEVRAAVATIRKSTPTYTANDRNTVVNANRRDNVHAYYLDFKLLQHLCMQILDGEGLKYADSRDTVHGILFDGAWLWEEYLYTLLAPMGYSHPQNNLHRGAITLFQEGYYPRYPDYMKPGIIADAKYKPLDGNGVGRDDMHQMISYMYVEKAGSGQLLYPTVGPTDMRCIGTLRGFGGNIYTIGLHIPGAQSMALFGTLMHAEETHFSHLLSTTKAM